MTKREPRTKPPSDSRFHHSTQVLKSFLPVVSREKKPQRTVRALGGPYALSKTKANYSKLVHTKKKYSVMED